MRVHGLNVRPRRRGLPNDDGLLSVIADSLLDRQFTAEAPNQQWIGASSKRLGREIEQLELAVEELETERDMPGAEAAVSSLTTRPVPIRIYPVLSPSLAAVGLLFDSGPDRIATRASLLATSSVRCPSGCADKDGQGPWADMPTSIRTTLKTRTCVVAERPSNQRVVGYSSRIVIAADNANITPIPSSEPVRRKMNSGNVMLICTESVLGQEHTVGSLDRTQDDGHQLAAVGPVQRIQAANRRDDIGRRAGHTLAARQLAGEAPASFWHDASVMGLKKLNGAPAARTVRGFGVQIAGHSRLEMRPTITADRQ